MSIATADTQVDRMRELMGRMANTIEVQNAIIENQRARITALEEAGWDVLPTLELYWRGECPIPDTHVTGALRKVLEEGQ